MNYADTSIRGIILKTPVLYILGALILLIVLFYNLVNKKYSLFQNIIFIFLFVFSIIYIQESLFPLEISFRRGDIEVYWSAIPFKSVTYLSQTQNEVINTISRYIIKYLILAIPLGFCVPILKKDKTLISSIKTSIMFFYIIEIIKYALIIINKTSRHVIDTANFIIPLIGFGLGYMMYLIFKKAIAMHLPKHEEEK